MITHGSILRRLIAPKLIGSAGGHSGGTPVTINYQFMVEPNGPNNTFTNTASWFVTAEMHNDDEVSGVATSPPFAVQIAGDHLQVVARYFSPGGNPQQWMPTHAHALDRPKTDCSGTI